MRSPFLLLAILLLFFYSAFSQTPASIKGTVIDSITQKPIIYVTVSLKNSTGNTTITILTKDDGSFAFEKLIPGKYSISFSCLGFAAKLNTVDLQTSTDLGNVFLSPANKQLNTISITAAKPLIKLEADRISYDIQADPESKGSTVMEIMRKVPMLSLDADDNILLKGDGNYKMLINGKPSALIDRSPKDLLRSMPASTIQRIEVITAPPAKYDAEGLTGIINIVTTKQPVSGYNGTLNLRQAVPVNSPSLGAAFTTRLGKLGISANAGLSAFYGPKGETTILRRSGSGAGTTTFSIKGERRTRDDRRYIQSTISYELDSLNLISATLNYNPGGTNAFTIDAMTRLSNPAGIIEQYNWLADAHSKSYGADASINYQLGFRKNRNRYLTFSYRYSKRTNSETLGLLASSRINYTDPDFKQQNTDIPEEQTVQADYIHPLKNLTVEAGLKAIYRNNNSDFGVYVFNPATNLYVIDPARTDKFNNDQNVFAAYNSYRYVHKDWDLRAGFRIEQTVIDAVFNSGTTTLSQNYFNIVPSIALSKKIKNNTLSFSYGQRLQRPGIGNLNPFVDRRIKGMEQSGNPALRPILSNNIQAGYSRSGKTSLFAGISYAFVNNMVLPVSVFDASADVTRTTFENVGKDRRWVANMSIGYPLTRQWNASLNGTIIYQVTEGIISSQLVQRSGFTGNASFGTGYSSARGWRLNGNINFNSRNIYLQGSTNTFISSSVSSSKDLIKDKLTFSASISNPFTSYRTGINYLAADNFTQTMGNRMYFRSVNASLNYSFGKLKGGVNRNKRGINNDDLL